jgi:Ca-activated chloride channel homolog
MSGFDSRRGHPTTHTFSRENAMEMTASFDHRVARKGSPYRGYLMVSITAEEDEERTPVSVALVLDVSGSMLLTTMGGTPKINSVKNTARKVIRNLTSKDEVTLVTYDSNINVLQPLTRGGNHAPLLIALDSIRCGSCTNLSGGILRGRDELQKASSQVKRILLLTDGLPNEGLTATKDLIDLGKELAPISLSTLGFGVDCDHDLLKTMAMSGRGQYYAISGKQDAVDESFALELGALVSIQAQNLTLVLPTTGLRVIRLINDLPHKSEKDETTVTCGDLHSGEAKNIIFEVEVEKDTTVIPALFLSDHKRKSMRSISAETSLSFGDEEGERNLEVAEQVALILAAEHMVKATEEAARGNFAEARNLTHAGCQELLGIGTTACKRMLTMYEEQAESFSETFYSAETNIAYAAAALGEVRGAATSSDSSKKTEGQIRMMRSFKEDEEPEKSS